MYSTIKHIFTASPISFPSQRLAVSSLRVIASHLSHTLSRRGKREVLRHHLKPLSSHDTAFSEPSSHCTFANRPFSGLARIPTTHIGNTPTSLPTNSKASPPANQKIPSEWNMYDPTKNPRNGSNRTAFLTCIFRMKRILLSSLDAILYSIATRRCLIGHVLGSLQTPNQKITDGR